jgi:hypothetical protein
MICVLIIHFVCFAEKNLKDKNTDYFDQDTGIFHQLKNPPKIGQYNYQIELGFKNPVDLDLTKNKYYTNSLKK